MYVRSSQSVRLGSIHYCRIDNMDTFNRHPFMYISDSRPGPEGAGPGLSHPFPGTGWATPE